MIDVRTEYESNVRHHAFTVKDYYKMAEAGILCDDDRVEPRVRPSAEGDLAADRLVLRNDRAVERDLEDDAVVKAVGRADHARDAATMRRRHRHFGVDPRDGIDRPIDVEGGLHLVDEAAVVPLERGREPLRNIEMKGIFVLSGRHAARASAH